MHKLVIEDDEGKTTVVPLVRDEITIGRKDGNTIRLTERNISRFHAKLVRSNGVIVIEDLDSYNGVKVNGDRISGRSQIKEGDVIELGDYHLQLRQESDLIPVGGGPSENTGRYSMDELARQSKDDITPVKVSYLDQKPAVDAPAAQPQRAQAPIGQDSTAVVRHPAPEAAAAAAEEARPITGPSAMLVIISQQFQGREFVLTKTSMHIGRTDDNDIALDHRSISKNHAKILLENGVYKIIDLKSANGVLVNGEQYAKTELKSGDTIELGHIKFRFVDRAGDEESYTPETQHTAVIHRSAISGKPASGVVKAVQKPAAVEAAGFDATEGSEPRKSSKTGLIIVVAVVATVLGGGGLWFVMKGGGDTPVPGGSHRMSQGPGKGANLVAEAKALMESAKWGEARNKLEQADPGSPEAKALLATVGGEESNKELYEKAKASATLNNWDDAWKKMNQISQDSYYQKMAMKELPAIKEKYIQAHLDAGLEAARAKDNLRAIAEFDKVLDLDDQHPVALREKRKLMGGGAPAVAEKEKPAPKQAAEPPKEKAAPKMAAKEKPPEKEQEPPPAAAQELTHIDYYNEGNKLYLQNRIVEAVAMFQKCIKANTKYPNCHRSLGIAYAKLGQGDKAAREYKVYLSLSPDAADRKQLQAIIDDFEKNQK